jgi:hypothetical protein
MSDVFAAAVEVQRFLESNDWPFCIIGGVALARWGEPRATADVDLAILTGLGDEPRFVDALLEAFSPRRENAREFALQNRVLLLVATNGVGIDASLAGLPFEERLVERASRFDFGRGIELVTASAEDMVVLKTIAGRRKDWADIEGLLIRQQRQLDWALITSELEILCELYEAPERLDELMRLRDELRGG